MNQLFTDAVEALHAVLAMLPTGDDHTFLIPERPLLLTMSNATARVDAVLGWVQATRLANEDAGEDHLFVATWFRCCEEHAVRAYQETNEAREAARGRRWMQAYDHAEEAVRMLVISDVNLMLLKDGTGLIAEFEALEYPQEDGE